jgi:hypothetical protein
VTRLVDRTSDSDDEIRRDGAYGFPPEGHAGVYRPLRFVRNLRSCGWNPVVVTAGGTPYQRPDPELLSQVPPDVEVLRPVDAGDWWLRFQRRRAELVVTGVSRTDEAMRSAPADRGSRLRSSCSRLDSRAESWWYHPDMERHWIEPATEAAVRACARPDAQVIWATGPPWSSFLAAEKASRRAHIPYVLDFRTSWTIVPSPFEERRPSWALARDRRVLRRLLAGARAVIFFYAAEAECFWRMYEGALDVSRIHVIPNGFDGEVEEFSQPSGETFTLLYTGLLADYRYDTFLEGLVLFKKNNPAQWRRLRVTFVGEREPETVTRVANLGLQGDRVAAPAGAARQGCRSSARSACAAHARAQAVTQGCRAPGRREAVQLSQGCPADPRGGSGRGGGEDPSRGGCHHHRRRGFCDGRL